MTAYLPHEQRYDAIAYRAAGRSGLKLPAISLGLWHNFGGADPVENCRAMLRAAFDHGITHFDLANNYGPPPGSAEATFGALLKTDFRPYRDELIVSTKAGYRMGPGPYGDGGSRKYLLSSLDQSLRRMGLEYVDIFYHHRPDPDTPLEETMDALGQAVRSGRALYVGLSNYPAGLTRSAAALLRARGTPCVIHQPRYNMFDRGVEAELLPALLDEGIGCIPFSPLAQGLLTDRYLSGIPADSRAAKPQGFLRPEHITAERLAAVRRLNALALAAGRSMSQLAIGWVLRQPGITSVLIGASRPAQVVEAVTASRQPAPGSDVLEAIEHALRS
jgi:L-glyceraldehyde 3-phosphate reductase